MPFFIIQQLCLIAVSVMLDLLVGSHHLVDESPILGGQDEMGRCLRSGALGLDLLGCRWIAPVESYRLTLNCASANHCANVKDSVYEWIVSIPLCCERPSNPTPYLTDAKTLATKVRVAGDMYRV